MSLTGQMASVDEDLTGRENLVLLGRLLGFKTPQARERADELLGAFGLADGGGPAGQELLGRHAPPARHRGEHRRDAAAAVPRRADDRPGPALAQPGVGHHPRARRAGHDRPALHAVPRRGRPARRPHRGHRPRQGHRRGHARRSSRRRSARARCTSACSTPIDRDEAERVLALALDAQVHREADPAALTVNCADAGRAAEALAALAQRRRRARRLRARPAEPRRGVPGAHRAHRRAAGRRDDDRRGGGGMSVDTDASSQTPRCPPTPRPRRRPERAGRPR